MSWVLSKDFMPEHKKHRLKKSNTYGSDLMDAVHLDCGQKKTLNYGFLYFKNTKTSDIHRATNDTY